LRFSNELFTKEPCVNLEASADEGRPTAHIVPPASPLSAPDLGTSRLLDGLAVQGFPAISGRRVIVESKACYSPAKEKFDTVARRRKAASHGCAE